MQIHNHFQHLTLTNDQRSTIEKLHAFLLSEERVFILQGYAGSGKTTLLKGIVEYLQSIEKTYQLMAPTGRAAKVIQQKTGVYATTVHKGIYSFDELHEITQGDDGKALSFLYNYEIRNNNEVHNSILIVDEASMVSDVLSEGEFFRFGSGHLLKDLITYGRLQETTTTSKIIFIGDPAQLPPVGMNFSPALDPVYIQDTYKLSTSSAEMKEVKRQDANNGILLAATKIRQSLSSNFFNDFDLRENDRDIFNPDYQDYLETYKTQQGQKIIICYKNKTASDLNRAIRQDRFGADLPMQSTDIVIVGGNNYRLGIMNGEFGIVAEASPSTETREVKFYNGEGITVSVKLTWRFVSLVFIDENNQTKNVDGFLLENYLTGENYLKPEEQRALYIDFKNRHPKLKKGTEEFKEAILNDKYFNCVLLKYGYAVTCHKAQGGEWASAFVFWDKSVNSKFNFRESEHDKSGKTNSDFYRWAYTAITRASQKLFCINPPFFSSFSTIAFVDVNVQRSLNSLSGGTHSAVEINFDEVALDLQKFGLIDAPLTIQNHFIHRWYHLRKHYIDIVEWQKMGYEIRYVFKREEHSAAFKFYVNGKNVFNSTIQKIPAQTNSDELYATITQILESAGPIIVNRSTSDGILTQIEFEVDLEEAQPFLKNLFDAMSKELTDGTTITHLQHLPYRERYTFERNDQMCVVDFLYDSDGFFKSVQPVENQCTCAKLLSTIKSVVLKLKTADYVI